MNETSVITWINIEDASPVKTGWYMVVLKPKNYKDFSDNPKKMNSWIEKFGIEKLWWNDGVFWQESCHVNERVNYWAHIPKVPIYK